MNDINAIFQKAFADHHEQRIEQAASGYKQVLAMDPDHASALHLLGLIEFDSNNYDKAMPLIHKSLELAPDEFQWILNYGKVLAIVGEFGAAISMYLKALCLVPENIEAKVALGDLYLKTDNLKNALKLYYDLLCGHPCEPSFVRAYADVLEKMGKSDEAERVLKWIDAANKTAGAQS